MVALWSSWLEPHVLEFMVYFGRGTFYWSLGCDGQWRIYIASWAASIIYCGAVSFEYNLWELWGWLYTIILGSNSTKQVAFVVYIWFSRREQEYIIFGIFTIHHHAPQYIIDKCISGANHGPPRIIRCPLREALGYNARKSKIHS